MNNFDDNTIYMVINDIRTYIQNNEKYYKGNLSVEVHKVTLYSQNKCEKKVTQSANDIFNYLWELFPAHIYWKSEEIAGDSLSDSIKHRILLKKERLKRETIEQEIFKEIYHENIYPYKTKTCLLDRTLDFNKMKIISEYNSGYLLLFNKEPSLRNISEEFQILGKSYSYNKLYEVIQNIPEAIVMDTTFAKSYSYDELFNLYGINNTSLAKVYQMLKSHQKVKEVSQDEFYSISNSWSRKKKDIIFQKEIDKHSRILLDKSNSLEDRIDSAMMLGFCNENEFEDEEYWYGYDDPRIISWLMKVIMTEGENEKLVENCIFSILQRWYLTKKFDEDIFKKFPDKTINKILYPEHDIFFLSVNWVKEKILESIQ